MSETTKLPLLNFNPWSVSKASLAGQCAKAFDYRYVQKVVGEPSGPEAKIGTAAHRVLELVLLGTSLDDAFIKTFEENDQLTHSEVTAVRAFADSYIKFRDKLNAFKKKHPIKELFTEKKLAIDSQFNPCDYDSPDCMIRGNIDVLIITETGHAVIIDHKTGKWKSLNKHKVQLDTYLVLVAAHFPQVKGLQAAIHHLAYNTDVDWDVPRSKQYVIETFYPWLTTYLNGQARKVEVVTASVTPLCGWCGFRNICAEWLAHAEKKSKT